jgi:hypothetical protein
VMDLNDFCEESHRDITRFLVYWVASHVNNPEMFPMDMQPGDWDEQFRLFLDTENALAGD